MPSGRVIAFLTDFGQEDIFVGVMKSVVLSIHPSARIIDLTHGVRPQDVFGAALALRAAYPYSPPGTIHVAVVDPGVGGPRRPLLAATARHYFVAPDNGLLTAVYEDPEFQWVRHIIAEEVFLPHLSSTFHGRDVFAPVAARLAAGLAAEALGPVITDPKKLPFPSVVRSQTGRIEGEVIHVDHFGNLFTNIRAEDVGGAVRQWSREFTLEYGGVMLRGLRQAYGDLPLKAAGMLINAWGYLEIFVNGGDACSQLGLRPGDKVLLRCPPWPA